MTNQIVGVSPLKVLLHCAIIQANPGVVMTETWNKQAYDKFSFFLISDHLTQQMTNISILDSWLSTFPHLLLQKLNQTQADERTIDELLLASRNDTAEVGAVLSAVFLCVLPGVPVGEVPVGQHGESGLWKYIFHVPAQLDRFKW